MTETRPPIPLSLAARPVVGGIAQPWVNAELAGGGVDFRSAHHARYEKCWTEGRCQSCGGVITGRAVLMCGPRQILDGRYDEPPACAPCALYVSQACPMVSGRTAVYPARPRLTEGHRGGKCPEGCGCGGWQVTDPEHSADQGGQPALPWYAVWIEPGYYQVTAHKTVSRCSDKGCEHERLIVNGATLLGLPLKIMLVAEPGIGRIWRRLTADEARAHATAALELIPVVSETYIVLIGHVVGNPEAGYDIVHDWDRRQFTVKAEAVEHGFGLAESDDFNIGVVRDGKLASLWWMSEQLAESDDDIAAIAAEIGLMPS